MAGPACARSTRRTGPPLGSKNRRPATRYDVGKTVKLPEALNAIGKPGRSWQMKSKLSAGLPH
ncbi:hypothetical protein E3E14_15025 [Streptomyces sp. ICN441]|nr:hypothetical protein E3E14_15025 [Streptomyces sp. ICN441]